MDTPETFEEETLQELLLFIQGKGKPIYHLLGRGIATYPFSLDENHQTINKYCTELEKRGLIYRARCYDDRIQWMPIEIEYEKHCHVILGPLAAE